MLFVDYRVRIAYGALVAFSIRRCSPLRQRLQKARFPLRHFNVRTWVAMGSAITTRQVMLYALTPVKKWTSRIN
jgi:hypothetical protein